MSIFTRVKEQLTARQVAENYGLKVGRNGMACCPFHDDHHPSMKIDTNYYCFSCGAKGDVIAYVAQMYGLSQYESAQKLNSDFQLGIESGNEDTYQPNPTLMKQMKERERIIRIRERFEKWCNQTIEALKECVQIMSEVHISTIGKAPDEIFSWEDYATIVHVEPRINYWLDILCLSELDEKQQVFMQDRGEVERIVKELKSAGNRILEQSRRDSGYGNEHCG